MNEAPTITASELAGRVGGTLHGDGFRVIRGVETLESAGPDHLSWVGTPEYAGRARTSNAGVLLMPLNSDPPPGKTVILVADPDVALCEALRALSPPVPIVPVGVHPTAVLGRGAIVEGAGIGPHVVIGDEALVGVGTQLHAGVYVGSQTRIGRDCILWPNVVVRERVTIGDRVILHSHSTIGADGFGYLPRDGRNLKVPQIGTVLIEDDVEIGANSTVDRAKSGVTRVGRGTKIDDLVIVGHNCDIGEHCILVGQSGLGGSTRLGDHCTVGGQSGVIDHRSLGDGVQIAAGSVVFNDVPSGNVFRGIPAQDHQRFLREQVAIGKLPELLKQMKALSARVAELENRINPRR